MYLSEQRILDIIRRAYRAEGLPMPEGLNPDADRRHAMIWLRIARSIRSESDVDRRQAARAASIIGASINRRR